MSTLKDSAQVSRSFVGALWLALEELSNHSESVEAGSVFEVVGWVPCVLGSRADVVLLEVSVDSFDVESLECLVSARGSSTGAQWSVNVADLLDVVVLEATS